MYLLLSLLLFFTQGPGPKKAPRIDKSVLLQLVNEAREKGCQCGDTYYYPVAPLKWHPQLETAAAAHSRDMSEKKYFAHRAPDGSNAGVRLERAGYRWRAYGENIAEGHRNEREVVRAWLLSPTHCKNIMNKDFTEMGAARVGNVWTQTFGKR